MSKLGALHITKPTSAKHTATVIIFHGSGGTGEDMKKWVNLMVKDFSFPQIKVLFPTAPLQPYTPLGGLYSNVWFDREYISICAQEKQESLSVIKDEVLNLIKLENDAGIPSNRIIAGGFSMGGALSLYTGYLWEKKLAGVFAFSSFLNYNSCVYEDLNQIYESEEKGIKIKVPKLLQLHGSHDVLVPFKWGIRTFDQLASRGVWSRFQALDELDHSINKKGMHVVKEWIEEILPDI